MMMTMMVDDKTAEARETQSNSIKATADKWRAKLVKSVRTFKFKRARTRREIQREKRREPLRRKLESIDEESEDDPEVSDDSSDYDIFGHIHEDSNPSDDDDEHFDPPGAGEAPVVTN